ncbi:MAG: SpoVR family protein [Bdellovibrionales bacterium]|nr:SpoVR family protein [Bdellovibrionales bacterium]
MSRYALPPDLVDLQARVKAAAESYGLECCDVVFEMLDYEEVNSVAARGGFPTRYPHWRFGMSYDQLSKGYEWGMQKIYEMVINTEPCYAYLLNSNPYIDQKLVMAHVYGHCDFFRNNFWFSKTNRKMMDQMANHAVRIRRYMDKHGEDEVENFIDRCLSVEDLIDPHLPFAREPKDEKPTETETETVSAASPRPYLASFLHPKEQADKKKKEEEEKRKAEEKRFPLHPEKDVLKFLLEHAPLKDWQADILSIIREEAYYFAPQRMTKIMNEGWASYWHSKLLTEKLLGPSEFLDFADRHAGVMATKPGGMNPYKLGIELFRHIEERWNKGKFGKDWDECDDMVKKRHWDRKLGLGRDKIFEVRRTHNDITFLDEFFTEEFCEEQKLYTYDMNPRTKKYEIRTRDWREVKEKMLQMLTNGGVPSIHVADGNYRNRAEILLQHQHHGQDLDLNYARATLANVAELWGRSAHIETVIDGAKRVYSWVNGEFSEEKQ